MRLVLVAALSSAAGIYRAMSFEDRITEVYNRNLYGNFFGRNFLGSLYKVMLLCINVLYIILEGDTSKYSYTAIIFTNIICWYVKSIICVLEEIILESPVRVNTKKYSRYVIIKSL